MYDESILLRENQLCLQPTSLLFPAKRCQNSPGVRLSCQHSPGVRLSCQLPQPMTHRAGARLQPCCQEHLATGHALDMWIWGRLEYISFWKPKFYGFVACLLILHAFSTFYCFMILFVMKMSLSGLLDTHKSKRRQEKSETMTWLKRICVCVCD